MFRPAIPLFACIASVLATHAVADNACPPLTQFASVDLQRRERDTRMFVPVTINGQPKLMLLDTGGFMSEVTPQTVDELHLPHETVQFASINLAGEESRQAADVETFGIGQLTTKSVQFVIAPERDLFNGDPHYAGILAPNVLKYYDVDIDFGAQKLHLLSPDHCEGKVIYWPAAAVAVVPIHVLKSGHIAIPVELDGKTVNALLDTGASTSTLTQDAAESLYGLKMGSPEAPYAAEFFGQHGSVYRHHFLSLNFGGIAVSNPRVALIPDYRDKLAQTSSLGSRLGDSQASAEFQDMLIGMDVLRHLHIYIAYKEQKLYVTPAADK
jgi:predicted aspartyl protease